MIQTMGSSGDGNETCLSSHPTPMSELRGNGMALLIGIVLALSVGMLATQSRLDRDRAFYPTVTIVVASYYALFAAMGASPRVLVVESLIGLAFLAVAVSGFRSTLWVVVLALAAHGVFDLAHGR